MTLNLEPLTAFFLTPYRWWHHTGRQLFDVKHYYQRARRGYSYRDTWNFDVHLAGVIVGGVRDLSRYTPGYPARLESIEEWQRILSEIADGFELLRGDEWEFWEEPERQAAQDKIDRAKQLFVEYFEALWD